ncbi:MAG TPA: hopanoid biosynthesis associated radical SAM protein HpnJ, partial [Candidatus Bathyarchaeia archaeon]|nr:hopanoid biosynthesis associated radical SAM protein HpnJ [Candidatus Bathyarchaeia archaeon]
RKTIDFAKELDVETIQVSLAHAYPGTELYDFAKANGFLMNEGSEMVDAMGHQVAMIEYPGISRDYILEMVHRFYDEYYFRPKAIFRIVRKAAFNSVDRKRLFREAKSFMKLRAARNRSVQESRSSAAAPPSGTGAGHKQESETAEPVGA